MVRKKKVTLMLYSFVLKSFALRKCLILKLNSEKYFITRFKVEFDNKLISEVLNIVGLMNKNISKNEIIPIREEQNCNLCSIRDNCLPFAYRNKNSKEKLIELIKRNDL